MKKRYLLLFCLSFLCTHKTWADVGSIQIRLNENMQVVDLATSSVHTNTDEVFVYQGGLTTAANTNAQFNADGELTSGNCPKNYTATAYGNKTYCCNSNAQRCTNVDPDNQCDASSLSYFEPICGCRQQYPWKEDGTGHDSNPTFCCDDEGAYTSYDGKKNKQNESSYLCGPCPPGSKVVDQGENQICCNNEGLVYNGTWLNKVEDCGCAIENAEERKTNCTGEVCSRTHGMQWCSETEECVSKEKGCPCVPGSENNRCTTEDECTAQNGCWSGGTCKKDTRDECAEPAIWDDDSCSCVTPCEATSPEGCSTETACNSIGANWCGNICQAEQCCDADEQLSDGRCMSCPSEGKIEGDGGEEVCCHKTETGKTYTNNEWVWDPAQCGCPDKKHLKGNNECVECINDDHCTSSGKKCNTNTNKCVECLINDDCPGDKVCNTDNICTCPTGTYWNDSSCVECDGDYQNSNARWPCLSSDRPQCKSGVCEACPTNQLWDEGKCVDCTDDTHCTSINAPHCSDKTCVQCTVHGDCSGKNKYCVKNQCKECLENEDCDKGYCSSSNECKQCRKGSDCPNGQWCDLEHGLCVDMCNTTMKEDSEKKTCQCDKGPNSKTPKWDAWRNRCVSCFRANETTPVWDSTIPDCKACSTGKVWDLYNEQCVTCYDSISANWTDLGCGDKKSHEEYTPTETATTPVCKVDEENFNNNSCVQCTEDSHCPTGKICHGNTCKECTASYDGNSSQNRGECPSNKPVCNQQGQCAKCESVYWTNTGECQQCNGHYGSGATYACNNDEKPYCHTNGKCVECGGESKYTDKNGNKWKKKQFGKALVEGQPKLGCYVCINDQKDNSVDKGCTKDEPICPSKSEYGYNVCCPTNKPKWNGTACDCASNYRTGDSCDQCKAGYTADINGKCCQIIDKYWSSGDNQTITVNGEAGCTYVVTAPVEGHGGTVCNEPTYQTDGKTIGCGIEIEKTSNNSQKTYETIWKPGCLSATTAETIAIKTTSNGTTTFSLKSKKSVTNGVCSKDRKPAEWTSMTWGNPTGTQPFRIRIQLKQK